ncbi:hypothetical protein H8M03_06975 [Sphingomonas sabuli]|uniref:Lipoprotein n=1 Tax=Sphingomonas sabuli TaxID=2764186 RepID=A0A7G9KZK9_9SPHN|nr:hypothetical protein [Sphingomonas sabuli]QNM81808.1 hypothetical protein H8M03_06975 [Sphingomonas sabuli]
MRLPAIRTVLAIVALAAPLTACNLINRASRPAVAARSVVPVDFIGCSLADPVAFTPDPAIHDRYLGRYMWGASVLDVVRENDRLLLRAPVGTASIRPLSAPGGPVFVDACGASYTFTTAPDGQTAILHLQRAEGRGTWHRTAFRP